MSLKGFHILFIVLSILLAVGCAVWGFANGIAFAFGATASGVAVVLVLYGIYFVRKTSKLIV